MMPLPASIIIVMEPTPTPVSDESFNDIFVELLSKATFPMKANELVVKYAAASFKVRQIIPNTDHDQLFELVRRMNYEAASEKAR